MGHELDAVLAHRGDERAARDGVEPVDAALHRCRQPPGGEAGGSVHASHTTERGARMIRSRPRSRSGFMTAPEDGDELLETVGAAFPDRPLLGEPAVDDGEALAVERARAHPPGLRGADQPAALEHADVLHERRQRHRRRPRQVADARRAPPELADHGTAGRVRERAEHLVEPRRILCHMAKYCGLARRSARSPSPSRAGPERGAPAMRRLLQVSIGLLAVFATAFGGAADANHVFNDVPTSSEFHDEIAEIGQQACADGFPGGLFKPNDPVKRQQMARFLSRCGGRVAATADAVQLMGPIEHLLRDLGSAVHPHRERLRHGDGDRDRKHRTTKASARARSGGSSAPTRAPPAGRPSGRSATQRPRSGPCSSRWRPLACSP